MRACQLLSAMLSFPFLIQGGSTLGADGKAESKGSWITFLSHKTGDNLLYRMRPDASDCKPVFGGPIKDAPGIETGMSLYRQPHWSWQSPDRKYFVSWAIDSLRPADKFKFSPSTPNPRFRLHLGRTEGDGLARVITPVCQEAAAWSPDSKRLVYAVATERKSSAHTNPPIMTRLYLLAIDGTSEDMIFEQPGYWTPVDWSPDGQKLLLAHGETISIKAGLMSSVLVELDMATIEKMLNHPRQKSFGRWQNSDTKELLEPVLGDAALVRPNDARYSPNGKFTAVTAIRKAEKPGVEWKALDFELGVIERATAKYKKLAWFKEGLRGPISWSPDGTEILFSRPLSPGDEREAWKEEGTGFGLWAIGLDGSGLRFLTTGWSPDWR
ncbi:MAG: hypothetical protein ACJ8FY_00460 [Gemmataceae bacterium]